MGTRGRGTTTPVGPSRLSTFHFIAEGAAAETAETGRAWGEDVPAAGGERGGGAHGDGVSGGDHLRVRLRSVCVRRRSDGGATWLERWKIARLWCKHVIDFLSQKV